MSNEIMLGRSVGIAAGFMIGLILAAIIFKFANKDKKMKSQYDERQELVRGKGYKFAFWTFSVCEAVFMIIDMAFPNIVPLFFAAFASIMIAGIVLALYCIFKGAYWGMNNNRKRYIAVFIAAGLINFMSAIMAIVNGEMVVDGKLEPPSINLMCGIMLVIIGVAIAIDSFRNKKESEE
ncbi:MAG: hypothetical protein MJZ11_05335 [Lachnospiraceae bacterium]|nr:hypothetical protein [Lachnospiraceae bacterium]